MRGYSNQSNKTVDRQLWKQIKATAIDSNTLGYEVTYDRVTLVAAIAVNSRRSNGNLRFTTKLYPTLKEFINYIFFENNMRRPINVSVQSTSFAAYPVKNYSLKTDYMSIPTHNTGLGAISSAVSNMADNATKATTALEGIKTLTIDKTSVADLADVTVHPWSYDLDTHIAPSNWGTAPTLTLSVRKLITSVRILTN